jgi:hypothetical protein
MIMNARAKPTQTPLRRVNSAAGSLRKYALAALAAGIIALAPATAAQAQSADADVISREYLIKAALLYNFAKFTEWPTAAFSDDTAPLRICVIGDDPFGPALDSLRGKTVRNRALAVTRIADVNITPHCHVLFVSASEEARLETILDFVGELPILSVADFGRFAKYGGIITLKEVDNRSRIEVNTGAAKLAGVKLSSKLLRLAVNTGTAVSEADPVVPVSARGAI